MKCTDLLTQEHKTILRALDILDHMAARIKGDQPLAVEDVETILHFLRAFADNQHQAKEESALFPELLRTSAANGPPLRQMIFEHDQERSLVEGLEDSLRTKRGMEFVHFDCLYYVHAIYKPKLKCFSLPFETQLRLITLKQIEKSPGFYDGFGMWQLVRS